MQSGIAVSMPSQTWHNAWANPVCRFVAHLNMLTEAPSISYCLSLPKVWRCLELLSSILRSTLLANAHKVKVNQHQSRLANLQGLLQGVPLPKDPPNRSPAVWLHTVEICRGSVWQSIPHVDFSLSQKLTLDILLLTFEIRRHGLICEKIALCGASTEPMESCTVSALWC